MTTVGAVELAAVTADTAVMPEFHVIDANGLAKAYASADYAVVIDGRSHPLRVGGSAPQLEATWPAASYVLLTAWNPASMPRGNAENEAADRQLCARLDGAGLARRPASAQGPDGCWLEPGWLVADAEPAFIDALAREFGQAAVLAWARGEPVRLRMLVPRAHRPSELPCVDWVE